MSDKLETKDMEDREGPMGKSDPNKPIEYRMVLIGRTGDGKSSAGNTILDQLQPKAFDSEPGSGSVTKTCKSVKKTVAGRNVLLVDTPGLFDTTRDPEDIKEEILGCVALSSPGPHVFLLVLKIGRATKEVKETYNRISDILGNKGQPYTIILFTNGDDLEYHGQSIEEYINKATDGLKAILAEAGHRYVVFNNRAQGDRREEQVIALLEKVDALVTENKGDVFTSDFYDEAEDALLQKEIEERDALLKKKEEEEKKLKERLKQKQKEIEDFDIERKQMGRVKQQLEHRENQMGQMQREYESKITQLRKASDAQYKSLEDRYKTDLVNVRDATRKEINANPKKVSESWFKGKLKRFLKF